MMKKIKHRMMAVSAATFVGLISGVETASAGGGAAGEGNFTDVIENMGDSISQLPGLITGVSYMMGITLGVLGILKIKDHVENPGQTPLQQGAVRLAAGGGLLALPVVYEAMVNTIGNEGSITPHTVNALSFDVD